MHLQHTKSPVRTKAAFRLDLCAVKCWLCSALRAHLGDRNEKLVDKSEALVLVLKSVAYFAQLLVQGVQRRRRWYAQRVQSWQVFKCSFEFLVRNLT